MTSLHWKMCVGHDDSKAFVFSKMDSVSPRLTPSDGEPGPELLHEPFSFFPSNPRIGGGSVISRDPRRAVERFARGSRDVLECRAKPAGLAAVEKE